MCGELWNRNSPSAVLEWALDALDKSDITAEEHAKLQEVAVQCVAKGGWRGDVSSRWKNLGFGSDKIEDFYP